MKRHCSKGEEMAYFTFSSTVVLLFEKDMIEVVQELKSGQELRLGEKIATDWLISKKIL